MCASRHIISLGENCLVDEVLKRRGLKHASFPFGSGRHNIEYVHEIVAGDFRDFLDPALLRYDVADGKRVVKHTAYRTRHAIFCPSVSNGFEFTHHDVLEPADRASVERKVDRFRAALRGRRPVVVLYNYRHSARQEPATVVGLLQRFLLALERRHGRRFGCLLFYQVLTTGARSVAIERHDRVIACRFTCTRQWAGEDNYDGRQDADLFDQVFLDPRVARQLFTLRERTAAWLRRRAVRWRRGA